MANSGSKTVTVAHDTDGDIAVQLVFSWAVSEQVGNVSYIDCSLKLVSYGAGAIYSTANKNYSVTVNGTTYSGTVSVAIGNNAKKTLWSKSEIAITHGSDGTKSFSYSFSVKFDIDFNGTVGTVSGNSTGTLPAITSSTGHNSISIIRGRTVQYSNSSGTSTMSDERIKDGWKDLDEYDVFFDTIKPQAFKYSYSDAQGRYHLGFSAQSIERALAQSGLSNMDFAGLVKYNVNPNSEEYNGYDEEYGLIYTEFVALLVDQMQKVKHRTNLLEEQSTDINKRLSELEGKLGI